MIQRGEKIAVVSRRTNDDYYRAGGATVVILTVTHVTKAGFILVEHGGWFAPEEEGIEWSCEEHVDALRVAVAL